MIQALHLASPFGLKGEIHAYPLSGQKGTLLKVPSFYQKQKESFIGWAVEKIRQHGDHYVVHFSGVSSIDEAKMLCGQDFYLKREDLPVLPAGHFYWDDLIGLQVRDISGFNYGSIISLYAHHHDVLVTSQQIHIPFLWQDTVLEVDFENRLLLVQYSFEESSDCDVDE